MSEGEQFLETEEYKETKENLKLELNSDGFRGSPTNLWRYDPYFEELHQERFYEAELQWAVDATPSQIFFIWDGR